MDLASSSLTVAPSHCVVALVAVAVVVDEGASVRAGMTWSPATRHIPRGVSTSPIRAEMLPSSSYWPHLPSFIDHVLDSSTTACAMAPSSSRSRSRSAYRPPVSETHRVIVAAAAPRLTHLLLPHSFSSSWTDIMGTSQYKACGASLIPVTSAI